MVDCEKIRSLIAEKKLEQKDVAEAVGVSEQMISYIVRGLREPSVTVLTRIAKVLDCAPGELIIQE